MLAGSNPKNYAVLLNPQVNSGEDNKIELSFDILSFDLNDDIHSWLYLEEITLEEAALNP